MSILDDAIREHLELKRQHGAPDDELKKLEDEAFGPALRPDDEVDPFAEAPTEFMSIPEAPASEQAPEPLEETAPEERAAPNVADLQEAPPPPPSEPEPEAPSEPEPAPKPEFEPADEEQPAMEHEVIPEPDQLAEPERPDGHTTQERHAIAEQPTEMFDVESELQRSTPETSAPRPSAPEFDEEDEFFDEQRLSDELDQALEGPPAAEVSSPPSEEAAAPEPEEPKPVEQEPAAHEDVLEETPDFLEESPEDDQLWFEQRPPKDFDFDD